MRKQIGNVISSNKEAKDRRHKATGIKNKAQGTGHREINKEVSNKGTNKAGNPQDPVDNKKINSKIILTGTCLTLPRRQAGGRQAGISSGRIIPTRERVNKYYIPRAR